MHLNDTFVRNIKATDKLQKHKDGWGLFLHVKPNGTKLWIFIYRFAGKQRTLSIGVYPSVTLKKAREMRERARQMLVDGIDPAYLKKKDTIPSSGPSFEHVALEFVANKSNVWSESHKRTVEGRLRLYLLPALGSLPVKDIAPQDVLLMLRKIEARKAYETASRCLGICSDIFRYGVAIGACLSDPCRDLRGALVPYKRGHFAAITKPKEAGLLYAAIDSYQGSFVVRCALKFSALTFARPGEVRHAEWSEVSLDEAVWIIPAHKMKMRQEHVVPLSRQAMELLNELRGVTGQEVYLFPTPRNLKRPISNNAINVALRSMGYTNEQMTAHGFRSMASTLLNEKGERHDVIEAQLAHSGVDKIRAIYNRAEYMEERRQLMQTWADYLEHLANL